MSEHIANQTSAERRAVQVIEVLKEWTAGEIRDAQQRAAEQGYKLGRRDGRKDMRKLAAETLHREGYLELSAIVAALPLEPDE